MEQPRRRPIDVLLATYGQSHTHPANEIIHCVCIPAIVFSVVGLLWALHPFLAIAGVAAALGYYAVLSLPLMLGMLCMLSAMLGVQYTLPANLVLPVAGCVFVLAWIGQFIGHGIEGKRPSFFEDLRYLLIGPLFVLGLLYRRLGISY